jgi:hypothetical protein
VECPGPIFLPEGASDVIALWQCGLSVIGRPSKSEGIELLAEVLRGRNREIIVLGENDQTPEGKLPGRDGAHETAKKLAALLGTPVKVAMPPDGLKDVREWVKDLAAGFGEVEDWPGAGRDIVRHLQAVSVVVKPESTSETSPHRIEFIDSAAFAAGDYRSTWLVKNVLVKGEPAVIGGPIKSLKTSVLVDLVVSTASGTPFLGKFDVPRKTVTAILSGESGRSTLQRNANTICREKGISLAEVGTNLVWAFELPKLSDIAAVTDLVESLAERCVELVAIDPLYLCAGPVDPKNMFEFGDVISVAAKLLLGRGIGVILAHHANRQLTMGEPMDLHHLAFSGLDAFTRQFLLLSRRSSYKQDGRHELWLRVGGSAGQGGLYGLDVDEGVLDEGFGGKKWDVVVQNVADLKQSVAEDREQKKADGRDRKRKEQESLVLQAVDSLTTQGQPPTKTAIKTFTGLGTDPLNEALHRLLADDILKVQIEPVTIGSGVVRNLPVYRRARFEGPSGPSGIPDGFPDGPVGRDQPGDHHPDTPIGGPGVSPDGHSSSRLEKTKARSRPAGRRCVPDGPAAEVLL